MKYKLCSVIEHIGSPIGGHYINAKKVKMKAVDEDAITEEWIVCNDLLLRKVTEE